MLSIIGQLQTTRNAIHFVNETIWHNKPLSSDVLDIVFDFIFNPNIFREGMVFFGRVDQNNMEYNLILLIQKINSIQYHSSVPYVLATIDFNVIFIWPNQSDGLDDNGISIGCGSANLIDNGKYDEYQFEAAELEFHPKTIDTNLILGCKYDLRLKLPDFEECATWNDWNGYMDSMSLKGHWSSQWTSQLLGLFIVHLSTNEYANLQAVKDALQDVENEELKKSPLYIGFCQPSGLPYYALIELISVLTFNQRLLSIPFESLHHRMASYMSYSGNFVCYRMSQWTDIVDVDWYLQQKGFGSAENIPQIVENIHPTK